MITYLHHTDPELPHYRQPEWNFQRGAAATVDRDFLGWMGRFFLHDVAHYHVVYHFFPKMPFCQSRFFPSCFFCNPADALFCFGAFSLLTSLLSGSEPQLVDWG